MNSVWWTLTLDSCYSNVLYYYQIWMTCDDLMMSDRRVSLSKSFSSLCIQIRKHKRPCILHPIINLKCKSHKSRPPLWNSVPSTHSQPPVNCIKIVQFQIKNAKHAAFDQGCDWKLCTRRITKSHSSPIHVNETQAPLSASKALLSADSYHFTSGLWASHG